jgi:hypothetical protein
MKQEEIQRLNTRLELAALADRLKHAVKRANNATARIAELEQQLYTAEQKYTGACIKLAAATGRDLPELDGTDAAHPAWWRGQDYGAASICRALTEVLDGKQLTGTCAEPLETLRRRVWEAREDAARLDWLARRTHWVDERMHLGLRGAIDAARGKP